MKKIVKDGKVAVITAFGYNCHWYTKHKNPALVFDPNIVKMINASVVPLSDDAEALLQLEEYCEREYGSGFYGDYADLTVNWIPKDATFKVIMVEGYETIFVNDENEPWLSAKD